ncbi:Rubrerythrin [Pseudoxanthobacter soli DSM 19599]|uniref:Rubrerythrin n=1 Tax=Pseudoxanthobacter soli DSM 19599 TaxID=1123029 RepID=A0A1M7Z527_9HYPH|nr:ferritin family protein [Pseudoxanthobacter soli]SHO59756.1 Rubrerythrin [Pseudoxanthobacter soli DSM 19599]
MSLLSELRLPHHAKRRLDSLSEAEVLAVAIASEDEDNRIYLAYTQALKDEYPATAEMFSRMAAEEAGHRDRLKAMAHEKFGDTLPMIRREDVQGLPWRRPLWLSKPLGIDVVRHQVAAMEEQSERFYKTAAARAGDPAIRELLTRLAQEETRHQDRAESLRDLLLTPEAKSAETEAARRTFVLQMVQPGLAGLMDGSVSTLAPLFAAAFATHDTHSTFVVGLAAAVGAGISMGFAEALSDDGQLSGRGSPWLRGVVCGAMTTIGGLGHTLPYLVPHFLTATLLAIVVVAIELAVIAYIRMRYMDTPLLSAVFQVVVGGVLVFAAGILIGSG